VEPAKAPIRFQDRRLMTLFFDFSSMQPDDQIRAQDAAVKFLQTQNDIVGPGVDHDLRRFPERWKTSPMTASA